MNITTAVMPWRWRRAGASNEDASLVGEGKTSRGESFRSGCKFIKCSHGFQDSAIILEYCKTCKGVVPRCDFLPPKIHTTHSGKPPCRKAGRFFAFWPMICLRFLCFSKKSERCTKCRTMRKAFFEAETHTKTHTASRGAFRLRGFFAVWR